MGHVCLGRGAPSGGRNRVATNRSEADADLVLLGQLEPVQNSQLGFELAGRVTSILVDEGDAVTAGQVLATLDTDLLVHNVVN